MATLSEDVEVTSTAAPVTVDGRFTDGRWFHFRTWPDAASLGASHEGPDGAVEESTCAEGWGVVVHRDLSHLGDHGADHITIPDAFDLLRDMAAELAHDPTPPTPES
jgi:hypothetical protein